MAEVVVEASLAAYNARDLSAFLSLFSDSIQMFEVGTPLPIVDGIEQVRNRYQTLFSSSPSLHANIAHRVVLGNKVIDHEKIEGRMGNINTTEMVLIYTVSEGLIIRVDFVK
jgi:hypothetical protein